MRTFQLTEEQIETIKFALQYTYDNNISFVNKTILTKNVKDMIIAESKIYLDTQSIFDNENKPVVKNCDTCKYNDDISNNNFACRCFSCTNGIEYNNYEPKD